MFSHPAAPNPMEFFGRHLEEALDAAIASGSTGGTSETFEQLDDLLAALGTSVGRA